MTLIEPCSTIKQFTLCLMAMAALATATPGGIISPLAYSSPLLAASPYTAGFASPYYGAYAATPYVAAAATYAAPYAAHYGGHYGAHYGGYHHPYGSLFLRR